MNVDLTREEIERLLSRLNGADNAIRNKLRAAVRVEPPMLDEFRRAWERHHKRNHQVWQVVLQTVIGRRLDWPRFAGNHPLYCDYWDRRGWQYCPETLMDWIDNGMMPPPPEEEKRSNSRVKRIAERS